MKNEIRTAQVNKWKYVYQLPVVELGINFSKWGALQPNTIEKAKKISPEEKRNQTALVVIRILNQIVL
jgi:hypothetical protein